MGFVQKNGAVNSINRSRIKYGMTNTRHSERSEESPKLSELTLESKVTGFNKSIPLFTSPLIRGEHSNPSLSREGFGMGFVQKNGTVNSINRSRISDSLRSHAYRLSHPHFVAVSSRKTFTECFCSAECFVKCGMTNNCHSERSEESQELSELISESKSIPLFTSPLIRHYCPR